MGTEFLKIIDSEEAHDIINKLTFTKEIEKVTLKNAHRRVLASDVISKINLPPFNRASRDGYAVKSEDTFGASEDDPVILKLIDTVRAGESATKKVEKGTCIEVSTGAPMPEGADSVVMVEFTDNQQNNVRIYRSAAMGNFVAPEGSDISKGDIILNSDALLTHDKIGVLAAVGIGEIAVFKKPKVAVISTGNEVIEYHEELKYGKIYDINSETITNAVKSCGCTPIYSGIVKDDYNDLKNTLEEHLNADVIITSGGTSAGAGDVLRSVLDDNGEIFVHGIAVKPGKPTIIGMINDKPLFGLPGYPAAALIVFHVFVAPYLRKMASRKISRKADTLKLPISRRYHSSKGRHQYVLIKIEDNKAHPILKDSGAITAIADADGYFEIPKNVEMVMEGTEIEVMLLESQ
ncbi:MAG: gephyrin-like molybdotransferase Glp [Methanobacterium sp.]